jgi:hypothetical protein
MKRALLVIGLLLTALGITVLFSGSLVLAVLLSDQPPPAALAPAQAAAEPQAVASAPPAAASPAPRAAPWAVAPARTAAQGWKPRVRDPSASGMADRVTRKAVRKALLAAPVEGQLARCVDRDREVGFGGGASPDRIPRAKPAVLMLDLEAMGHQVKIADARVKSWGGASHAAVACARDALSGRVVAVARGKPDRSMQMPFLLNPRSRAPTAVR